MAEKGEVAMAERTEDAKKASMRTAETLLRLLPLGLCVAALVVMLKNSETNEFGSVFYSDLGAFKYLIYANGVCAGYSLFSAVFTAVPRPFTMSRAWTFFLLDQLFTYVIIAAGAVSTEVVYLAYHGDKEISWSEACGTFGGFCKKATVSVSITFIAVICYISLSLISSYRLFTRYDPPSTHSNKDATEMGGFYG
ncbi:CASP-like protein 2A1 [Silene latifolia]|uniref:CASP-like protein 2A1 n=1 Tax=Silene latifolia TaxID=37657 RepID=UPI003D783BF0